MKERKFATGPSGGLQQEHLDVRRRRLLFRCWQRGTKEGDLILGSFAETCLTQFDSAQLNRFEGLLNCSDTDLFGWIIGGRAPPREYDHDVMRLHAMRPIIINNFLHCARVLGDACEKLRRFSVEGTRLDRKRIDETLGRSLMLVTALSPVIGYDKASAIAHKASGEGLTLKEAALKSGYVGEKQFDEIVDPHRMVGQYGASPGANGRQLARREAGFSRPLGLRRPLRVERRHISWCHAGSPSRQRSPATSLPCL